MDDNQLHPAANAAVKALGLLYDVIQSEILSPFFHADYSIQACEAQETTRDAAQDMLDALASFLDIYGEETALQVRLKPKDAQKLMLLLIARIANYIRDQTKTGVRGTSSERTRECFTE